MTRRTWGSVTAAVLLAACSPQPTHAPYAGPVAAPQVAYRIDGHRYFEVVPREKFACARARLFYNDTAHGIRSDVASWDRVWNGALIIDAATDNYLVSPIINSSSACQTGGGDLCASRLYYSQNGGRSWQIAKPRMTLAGGAVHLIGDTVFYAGQRARVPDLVNGDQAWLDFFIGAENKLPSVARPPVDTRLHCESSGKE